MRVGEIASSPAPLPEAIRAVVGAAVDLLGADQGSVMLLDGSGADLVLVASHGLPPGVPPGTRVAVGDGVAGRVLATNRPLCLGRVDGDSFVNFVPKQHPIHSSVVVPLRFGGRARGVLSVAVGRSRKAYADDDVRVAQMFADQAAGLILRARGDFASGEPGGEVAALLELTGPGTRPGPPAPAPASPLAAVAAVGRELAAAADLDTLLQRVLDGATRLGGRRDGFVCLFDEATGALTKGAFRGIDKASIRSLVADEAVRRALAAPDSFRVERDRAAYAGVAWRTRIGTKGLVVTAIDARSQGWVDDALRILGHQCAAAVGAAELDGALEAKEWQLSSIINGVPTPLVLVDDRGRIAALNAAAETLFGVSAVFSVGTDIAGSLDHPEIERLLTATGDIQVEVSAGTPPRVHKARVADVRVPGVPLGRVLVMDDVSAERALIQMQRDFVSVVGHELRTPLTVIKGFTKTLLRKLPDASPAYAADALRTIEARTDYLERLIEDVLYLSRIEAREATLRMAEVDVVDLVEGVTAELLNGHRGREIVLDTPAQLVWVCDETKVALIVRHLVENALKYSEAPEPVVVRAELEDDHLRIDVKDRGIGIVSTDVPLIFERFRQLDGTSTRRHGGTGVGLYLCDRLVRVHGGRLWVDSTWGKGSTFSLVLPRRGVAAGPARRERAARTRP